MNNDFCKCISLSDVDTLTIGNCNCKNYIDEIIDTFVKIKITKIKLIKGKFNHYVYITGCKIIKIHYVTNDCTGLIRSSTFLEPFNTHFSIDSCIKDLSICDYYVNLLCKEYDIICDDSLSFSTFYEICIKFDTKVIIPDDCFSECYDSLDCP